MHAYMCAWQSMFMPCTWAALQQAPGACCCPKQIVPTLGGLCWVWPARARRLIVINSLNFSWDCARHFHKLSVAASSEGLLGLHTARSKHAWPSAGLLVDLLVQFVGLCVTPCDSNLAGKWRLSLLIEAHIAQHIPALVDEQRLTLAIHIAKQMESTAG